MTGNSVQCREDEKEEKSCKGREEEDMSGKSRRKVGQAPAPLRMGIRCCQDQSGLAYDEATILGDAKWSYPRST